VPNDGGMHDIKHVPALCLKAKPQVSFHFHFHFRLKGLSERNFREFREFWPYSRKFISRKIYNRSFAKVSPNKVDILLQAY